MRSDALTKVGNRLFPSLCRFKNFYLVGGTALALQIEHRLSVDFDLFSPQPLPQRLLQQVKRVFVGSSIIVMYNVPGQLNVAVDDLKMTFFEFDYPIIDPLLKINNLNIASIREIAAMKALAIGKRLSYKDYVDWYFLLQEEHVTLAEVIEMAQQKFGGDFNDRLFLGQLASLSEISEVPITFLRDPVDKPTIQNYLEQQVRQYLDIQD